MSVASALVAGNNPLPALAEEALAQALARTGASHATGVLLFLTPDFSRHAQQQSARWHGPPSAPRWPGASRPGSSVSKAGYSIDPQRR